MEFVALSDLQLTCLAQADAELKRVFRGVFPSDKLPKPSMSTRAAYVVNTDPSGEPGQHWLAVWTQNNVCEVLDSFGLPLTFYEAPGFHEWIARYWTHVVRSNQTLQAINSKACGHYAILFLKARARGRTMQEFVQQFSDHDLVMNDHVAGQHIKALIHGSIELFTTNHCKQQTCQTRNTLSL